MGADLDLDSSWSTGKFYSHLSGIISKIMFVLFVCCFYFLFHPLQKFEEIKPKVKLYLANEELHVPIPDSWPWGKEELDVGCILELIAWT